MTTTSDPVLRPRTRSDNGTHAADRAYAQDAAAAGGSTYHVMLTITLEITQAADMKNIAGAHECRYFEPCLRRFDRRSKTDLLHEDSESHWLLRP